MIIKKINIKDINPAKYNPRKDLQPTDPEYQHIKNSIINFGYIDPIVWNEQTGNLVGGHQRLKILVELGNTEVDCVVVSFDDKQEKAANLALNKAQGDWDMEALEVLLGELEFDYDMGSFGFDIQIDEIAELTDDEFDLDQALQEIEEPISQVGDIFKLGRHYLMCGDTTIKEDIDKLMNGNKAALIITDPPYNVDYEEKNKQRKSRADKNNVIHNDNLSEDDFQEFIMNSYKNIYESIYEGAAVYVFHAESNSAVFRSCYTLAGFKLSQICIWVKNSIVMSRQDYQWQHEPVIYGWKPGKAHSWYSDRKQTTLWHYDRPVKSEMHPTMKPIPLICYPMLNSSKKDDIVADFFGGSGTTLMAAEQTGRVCYMMEKEPIYCDVIIKRWESFTGLKAERI